MKPSISQLLLVLMLTFLPQVAFAKDWQGVVPLKTTRAEVESRFGKPDKWGYYNIKNERVSFEYGDQCKGLYLALGVDNCKCLTGADAVMSIFVEPTTKRRISALKLDLKNYRKTPISPFPQTFTYTNSAEGIVYTVDESEGEVMHITYYPSAADCEDIITKRTPANRNSWRGLVPLHSARKDVERLLGTAQRDRSTEVTYETDHESIVAQYSAGNCDASPRGWNVPKNTLIELVINPNPSFLLKELNLDPSRYARSEIFPYTEIDNPPRVWLYIDKKNGISIRTQSSARGGRGEELVVSIIYSPAQKDEKLRCGKE
ncbi:MAG TPA: hypothetical protein VJP89_15055 [Pyrinomonadaceae bacterium]|nr:hypothetical protein [Pyrinomonadaceae bacterium]